jgi:hypothetical protein
MRYTWTTADIDMLPVMGGFDVLTDPQSGVTFSVRRPQRFIVTDDDTYCVVDTRTGDKWRIGLDMDGEYWKERIG